MFGIQCQDTKDLKPIYKIREIVNHLRGNSHVFFAALLCDTSRMHSPEELAIRVGTLIKNRRLEKGLSLEELSVRAGLDRSSISLYESYKCAPTISSAAWVAKALNIRPSELIRQAEDT